MKIPENIKRLIVVICTVIAGILLIYFGGRPVLRLGLYLFSLLSPFIFGYIFAKLINPIADRLQRRLKFPRGVSTVLLIFITLAALGGIIGVLGYKLVNEIKNLYYDWPMIAAGIDSAWKSLSSQWSTMFIDLPDSVQNAANDLKNSISSQAGNFMSNMEIVNNAQDFAKSVPAGIIWTIIFVLSMFFMVSQKEKLDTGMKRLMGDKLILRVEQIKRECRVYLGGYVRAQIIIMFIMMATIAIILSILRAPFALLIAAGTAILDALPVFGSGITLWPLAIFYFISGNIKLGIGYVAVYLILVLLRRIIEPKLVSDKMGLNPILTLISMYIGYRWWGLFGMIVGPILLMAIISIYKVGLFDKILAALKQLFGFFAREIKMFADYLNNITK